MIKDNKAVIIADIVSDYAVDLLKMSEEELKEAHLYRLKKLAEG